MQKLKIRQGDWVIVCDGKKALVLENAGDEKFLNLRTREVHEHPDPKTHELGTDAPGRAFSSVGTERSSMEQTDWHAQEEDRLLRKLADRLDAAVNAGLTKSLILIAPPRAPKSTRISSSFPCMRSRSISRDEQGGRRGCAAAPSPSALPLSCLCWL